MKVFNTITLCLLMFLASCMTANKASDIAGSASSGTVTTTGTGVPASALVASPSTYSFGTKTLATSTSHTFTIYNQADAHVDISAVNIAGSMYTIGTDTCTGVTLGANASCSISATFTPITTGNFVAVVTVDFSTIFSTVSSLTFNMNGAGSSTQPTLTLSPASYAFGNVNTSSSSSVVFTVSNSTSVSALLVTPSISGTDYTISSQTCNGGNLTSGGSCTVTVKFQPTATVSRAGTLTVNYNSVEGNSYSETAVLSGTGIAPSVAFVFDGFNTPASDVTLITPTGAQLNWTAQPAATSYRIVRVIPGPATTLVTITTPATNSYILTGLTPATSYQYKINAYDALGISDGNNNLASFTTTSGSSATFNGWNDVIATGSVYSDIGAVDTIWGNIPTGVAPSPPTWPTSMSDSLAIVSTSTTKQNAQVKIAWDAFTFSGGGVATSHVIYRGNAPGGPYTDITAIGGNVLSGNTFIDNNVSNQSTYYYKVHPIQGAEIIPAAASDTEIKIYVPPQNMNLIHRWIANRETCVNLLGKSFPADFDRSNNYRCNYVWGRLGAAHGCVGGDPSVVDITCNHAFAPHVPWNDKAYWDIGYSLIVDRYEAGCKISAKAGSKGNALPGGGFVDGDVFGGTGTSMTDWSAALLGNCYLRVGGSWLSYALGTASAAQHAIMTTNEPGYAPVTLTQAQSYNACNARSVAGIGNLRLWRRHEIVAGRAWTGTFNTPTTFQTALWTSGSDVATNGSCNTYNADGGSGTSPIFSTPNGNWHAITGSWATRNCKSRYDIQDTIGNLPEWTSDQLSGCNNVNGCTFGISSLDSGNIQLENLVYDNVIGKSWLGTDPGYYNWVMSYQTSTMFPMFGVTATSVNANYGSRTVSASLMTQESSLPSRGLSILGAIDGWGGPGWSLGRFGLGLVQPTVRVFTGYGNNVTIWGGSTYPGYRCVGQVP